MAPRPRTAGWGRGGGCTARVGRRLGRHTHHFQGTAHTAFFILYPFVVVVKMVCAWTATKAGGGGGAHGAARRGALRGAGQPGQHLLLQCGAAG